MLVLEGLKHLKESLDYIVLAIQETRSLEGQWESVQAPGTRELLF